VKLLPKIQKAWEWRKAHVEKHQLEAFRLVNGAGDELPGLAVDYYSGAYQIVYKESDWLAQAKEVRRALAEISRSIDAAKPVEFFEVENLPAQAVLVREPKLQKRVISENGMKFEIHLGEALHTGLFLDQRESRRTVYYNAQGRRVLNLFSYTGAFSLTAFKGGADSVVSVDLSKNYLAWLQRNVELNGFPLEKSKTWPRDVFDYLKLARKKAERFDLIILDPPTFSRSGKGNFSTDKNFDFLVSEAAGLLSPEGNLFASINTLKMTREDFQAKVRKGLQGTPFQILKPLSVPRDFKLTPAEEKNPYLKACWIGA